MKHNNLIGIIILGSVLLLFVVFIFYIFMYNKMKIVYTNRDESEFI